MSASLSNFTGTLVLVGAGKMGGAMLEGWFALGLDPRKVAILEPKPAPEIAALKDRGVRVNPPIDDAIGGHCEGPRTDHRDRDKDEDRPSDVSTVDCHGG